MNNAWMLIFGQMFLNNIIYISVYIYHIRIAFIYHDS